MELAEQAELSSLLGEHVHFGCERVKAQGHCVVFAVLVRLWTRGLECRLASQVARAMLVRW